MQGLAPDSEAHAVGVQRRLWTHPHPTVCCWRDCRSPNCPAARRHLEAGIRPAHTSCCAYADSQLTVAHLPCVACRRQMRRRRNRQPRAGHARLSGKVW